MTQAFQESIQAPTSALGAEWSSSIDSSFFACITLANWPFLVKELQLNWTWWREDWALYKPCDGYTEHLKAITLTGATMNFTEVWAKPGQGVNTAVLWVSQRLAPTAQTVGVKELTQPPDTDGVQQEPHTRKRFHSHLILNVLDKQISSSCNPTEMHQFTASIHWLMSFDE